MFFFFFFLRKPRSAGGKYICYYLINLKSMEATGIISSRFDDGLAPSLFNILGLLPSHVLLLFIIHT